MIVPNETYVIPPRPPATRRLAVAALLSLTLPLALAPPPASAAVPRATRHVVAAKRAPGATELVIYNDDLALVREPYSLRLSRGRNEVTLEGVPRRIDSTSVRLEGDGFRVMRQSFDYDLWSGDRVFRRFLGDSIRYRYSGRVYGGRLVGIEGDDLFIERRDSVGVITMINRRMINELEFPASPGLATQPSLRWDLESAKGGDQAAVLSYLTSGIEWTAEYALVLDPGEKEVELTGWASIVNRTGTSFEDAKVSLVAGDLHRAGQTPDRGPAAVDAPPRSPEQSPPDLFAYHLYPVAGAMDLRHLETTLVPIVGPSRVSARRAYVYDAARDGSRVRVRLELGNEKSQGLGVPLPAGRVRVYDGGHAGARALVGEDAVGHTAAGEKVNVLSGTAFDLVGDRTRVSHTRVSRSVTEDAYTITIRNRGQKPATVTVVETLYGNWEITAKSSPFRRKDADTIEFDVAVPAG
ncbi:MAG TPA: DUF4139 domain-containing protein, partial [Candidatus Limnocylindrales bacterium]|nr:DUF4139 domain-containing protein [Candidatus Limnocylindrales bacterium]